MATLMRRQPLADFAGLHDQLEAIEAQTRDGLLEVRIPLPAQPQKKAVEITPKAG